MMLRIRLGNLDPTIVYMAQAVGFALRVSACLIWCALICWTVAAPANAASTVPAASASEGRVESAGGVWLRNGFVRLEDQQGRTTIVRNIEFEIVPEGGGRLCVKLHASVAEDDETAGAPGSKRDPASESPINADGAKDLVGPEGGGEISLRGRIVPSGGSGGAPRYQMTGDLRVIRSVRITPQMSTVLLSRLNPVAFYRPKDITGRFSLALSDVDIPLGKQALQEATISRGRLEFEDLRMRPRADSVLGQVLSLLGVATAGLTECEIPGVDFEVHEGRIQYGNFKLIWKNLYHLKFSGSVGLDGSVDLAASFPITPDLITRIVTAPKLPGPAEVIVSGLTEQYITVPVKGSWDNTVLDHASLASRLQTLGGGILNVPGEAVKGVGEVLKGIGGLILRNGGSDGETKN